MRKKQMKKVYMIVKWTPIEEAFCDEMWRLQNIRLQRHQDRGKFVARSFGSKKAINSILCRKPKNVTFYLLFY